MVSSKREAFRVIGIAGVLAILVAALFAVTHVALQIYRIGQYRSLTRRIDASIENLAQRRPQHVNAHVWDEACGWLQTANANICFDAEHVPMENVRELCVRFETRVNGPVDLDTVEWMWDEFAAASPHGAQYAGHYRASYLEFIEYKQPELLTDKTRERLDKRRQALQLSSE